VVCLVEDVFVIDASLDQATSVANELRVPGVLAFPLTKQTVIKRGMFCVADDELFVEYVVSPTAIDYTKLADWDGTPEVVGAVDRILEQTASMAI